MLIDSRRDYVCMEALRRPVAPTLLPFEVRRGRTQDPSTDRE